MNKKKQGVVLLALVAAFVACLFVPCVASAAEAKSMYRLYNQWTGEHLYTADANERKQLVAVGWTAEGDAWDAPAKSSTPVWRLYNPYVPGGDHHYTKDKAEYDALKKAGWRQEGLAWYSDDARGEALFRLYNPYAQTGTHHYTVDTHERNELEKLGWNYEGIAWYGVSSGPEYDYTLKSGVKSYSNYDWLGASSYVVRQASSAPKVGDKIVIDPTDENPFGAAGTITSVSRRSDGSYSVSIRQATDPSEVFTDIEVKQAPVEADRDKAVVSGASGASGGGVDLSGDWEPEGDAFGASFDVDLGSGSYAKGGFSIKPTIGYDIKWTIFGGLERCELSVGGKVDLDVETHVQNKNAGKDIKVFEASVPIAYGFSVDLPLYVHISAEGDLTLAVDYEMDTTMSLVNGKWVPFDHSDFGAELSAAVHLRLGGKVGAELKWLQVQLVDAAVGAGADGTAKTTIRSAGLTCADLSAYMYLDVEIGKGTDYLKKLGWTLDKEILNASNSPLKLALHFENGNRVPECTWGKEDEKPSEPEEPAKTSTHHTPGLEGPITGSDMDPSYSSGMGKAPSFAFDYPAGWEIKNERTVYWEETGTPWYYTCDVVNQSAGQTIAVTVKLGPNGGAFGGSSNEKITVLGNTKLGDIQAIEYSSSWSGGSTRSLCLKSASSAAEYPPFGDATIQMRTRGKLGSLSAGDAIYDEMVGILRSLRAD